MRNLQTRVEHAERTAGVVDTGPQLERIALYAVGGNEADRDVAAFLATLPEADWRDDDTAFNIILCDPPCASLRPFEYEGVTFVECWP